MVVRITIIITRPRLKAARAAQPVVAQLLLRPKAVPRHRLLQLRNDELTV